MILQIDDWEFDIDMTRTMEYSAAEAAEHCTCASCRNFYAAVDVCYPNLRPFLAQFGLDIEAPEELFPYDIADKMIYEGNYWVCGSVLRFGKNSIHVGNVGILPTVNRGEAQGFVLSVSRIILPWMLDEPMKDTVSPANEPSFLRKMWDRLLDGFKKDEIPS